MGKSVVEAHRQLYHYTTAAGLQGILESQQLWATHISYLNDAEEHTGFFDRRLPQLLDRPIRDTIARAASEEVAKKTIISICDLIRDQTLKFNSPYVTSFCRASSQDVQENGLLSQWRGYGLDGGYAIVFETVGLQQLLEEEEKNYCYQVGLWGDVEYYDQDTNEKALHSETLERELIVQQTIRDFCAKLHDTSAIDSSEFEPLYVPIAALACCHKHRGFREEAEVRIVAVPSNSEVQAEAQRSGDKRQRKPVHFAVKNGVPVPSIRLFGQQPDGNTRPLPIAKVIVGPHPERLKRQKAVELVLEQYGVEARVTASDIPYLGR